MLSKNAVATITNLIGNEALMAPYYLFGPKNVGSLDGKSFESLNGGRRLMSRQTGGVRTSRVKFPAGGLFGIFGSRALLPGKIVMPHTTEGFAGICGEINGRVGSLGFWAVSGATAATMTPHRTPKRQVNFIPSSFGFSRYSAAPVKKIGRRASFRLAGTPHR